MKKIFTLLTGVLLVMGAQAQTLLTFPSGGDGKDITLSDNGLLLGLLVIRVLLMVIHSILVLLIHMKILKQGGSQAERVVQQSIYQLLLPQMVLCISM